METRVGTPERQLKLIEKGVSRPARHSNRQQSHPPTPMTNASDPRRILPLGTPARAQVNQDKGPRFQGKNPAAGPQHLKPNKEQAWWTRACVSRTPNIGVRARNQIAQ